MIRPSGLTVGRLIRGIPAPNDGGEEAKLLQIFSKPAFKLAFPIWNACGQFIDENLVVQPCFRTQSRVQGGVRAC